MLLVLVAKFSIEILLLDTFERPCNSPLGQNNLYVISSEVFGCESFFIMLIYLFWGGVFWGGAEREREREGIPNSLHTGNAEPYVGLNLMNGEIMT